MRGLGMAEADIFGSMLELHIDAHASDLGVRCSCFKVEVRQNCGVAAALHCKIMFRGSPLQTLLSDPSSGFFS